MAKLQKNGKIELLRFIFSLIVMLFHTGNIPGIKEQPLFPAGAFAVEFFFIISGYLMMASIERSLASTSMLSTGKETFLFIKKKVVGIYPEIFLSWLLSIGVYTLAEDLDWQGIVNLMTKSLGDVLLIKSTGLNLGSVNGVVWYISSMLLVMAILFPLIKKYKDIMLHVILPLGVVVAFGYLCQEAGVLRKPDQWLGPFTRGLPRAFGEIALGVICYPIVQKLANIRLSWFGKLMLTVLEWVIYLSVIWFMYSGKSSKVDYFYILFLAVAIVITFSGQTLDSKLFNNKFCYWLGKFSLSIYLAHAAWCKQIGVNFLERASVEYQLKAYIFMSIVSAFCLYFVSLMWRKVSPTLGKLSRKVFFKS